MAAQARGPIFGLVPQRHLEDHNMIGVSSGTHNGLLDACEVNVGYTLWRNPEARSDLADLGVLPAVHVNHILLNQPRRACVLGDAPPFQVDASRIALSEHLLRGPYGLIGRTDDSVRR